MLINSHLTKSYTNTSTVILQNILIKLAVVILHIHRDFYNFVAQRFPRWKLKDTLRMQFGSG